jgi:hypothetical protein
MELLVGVLVAGALVATFLRLRRGRADVMDYHGIETPRISEATRGGGDGGAPESIAPEAH